MRWIRSIGWSVFAVLTVVIAMDFLWACNFRLLGFARNTCVSSAPIGSMSGLQREQDALMRQIHLAELKIAEKPVCVPVEEPRPPDPSQKRAYDRGAKQGKLEVFADWSTADDVDLSVQCPGGTVGGVAGKPGPGICGDGKLDLDANRNLLVNVVPNPVEHIVWQNDIPAGDYVFGITLFKTKNNRELHLPVRLRIRIDDEERVCTGIVPYYPQSQNRLNAAGRIIAGQKLLLRWTYGQPLPECNWEYSETTYCGPGQCNKN